MHIFIRNNFADYRTPLTADQKSGMLGGMDLTIFYYEK
jgi:hypothetical protein